jgi:hypothetical protein
MPLLSVSLFGLVSPAAPNGREGFQVFNLLVEQRRVGRAPYNHDVRHSMRVSTRGCMVLATLGAKAIFTARHRRPA